MNRRRRDQQSISDHATRLFVERGFERTTISDIARPAARSRR
ncbi:TetR family transcriptional regulator [Nonomuraea dietziae]